MLALIVSLDANTEAMPLRLNNLCSNVLTTQMVSIVIIEANRLQEVA